MVLKLVALLTGLAGIILNGVIYLTIVKVSENYSNIPAISEAWKVIRDVANMGFIFVLLYAAIQTILGIGSDTKKLIVNIVVVAILINFSLFFTKVVIDASNVLAITFYDAIAPGALNATGNLDLTQAGLSNAFMQHLSLQSLYKVAETGQVTIAGMITIGVMGSIMLIIAAFVFFAVAIMLIIRYVILILVIILSPIAFIAFVLPALKPQGEQWKNALIGQAFFAPIYFMLTWVTLRVLGGIMSSTEVAIGVPSGSTAGALGGIQTDADGNVIPNAGTFIMFLNFAVVIVFLIASLIIAKQWADKAGHGVPGLTKWAMGAAGGASFGLAGRAGRLAAGGFAMSPDSEKYKRLEAKSAQGGVGGATARLRLAAADKARTSSFDIRGGRLGGVLGGAGLEAGQASGQGGFEADKKAVREFLERPGTEAYKKRQERGRKAQGELDIMAGVGPAAVPAAARTPQQQAAVDAMERAIVNSTDKEIEAIVDSNRQLLQNQEFANNISVRQLEAINKSDKFTEAEKDGLKARRFGEINAALAPGGPGAATVRTNIRRLSDTELEMINPAHLGNTGFVSQLQPAQIETINKSIKFTTGQKSSLRTARRAPLLAAIAAGNVAAAQAAVRELGHKEIAALDMATLLDGTMGETYTPQILKRMAPEMNPADIQTLRTSILQGGGTLATIHWLGTPDGAIFS